jgi:hypothetical protein
MVIVLNYENGDARYGKTSLQGNQSNIIIKLLWQDLSKVIFNVKSLQ